METPGSSSTPQFFPGPVRFRIFPECEGKSTRFWQLWEQLASDTDVDEEESEEEDQDNVEEDVVMKEEADEGTPSSKRRRSD